MAYSAYKKLSVTVAHGVATVVIDNQECQWGMNIFTPDLNDEISDFSTKAEVDDQIRAIILRSADPDFFIAHYDVSTLVESSAKVTGKHDEVEKRTELGGFHQMCERFRTMPKVTIAEIAGRAGGGGNELASSCDMRFGLYGKTKVRRLLVIPY